MWTAAWGERKAETGIDADRGTNVRDPGEAGETSADSDSKVAQSYKSRLYFI